MTGTTDKPDALSDVEASDVRDIWRLSAEEIGLTADEYDTVWTGWSWAMRDATWDEAMLGVDLLRAIHFMAEMKKRGLVP